MKRNALIATVILSSFLCLAASAADDFNLSIGDHSDRGRANVPGTVDQDRPESGVWVDWVGQFAGINLCEEPSLNGTAAHPAPNASPLVKMIFRYLLVTGQTLQCGQGTGDDRNEGGAGFTVVR